MEIKELKVNAIKNGSVIDHIESLCVFKILKILNIKETTEEVLIGTNLSTNTTQTTKGVIKITNKYFTQNEINKIAILSKNATLNIIRNYNVIKKFKVKIPDIIHTIIKCFNPNCITNHEKINTKFIVLSTKKLKLKCTYCEKIIEEKNIEIK